MAEGNLAQCLATTLEYEGGYVDHPSDPGGATNMGITFDVLREWRRQPITKADVRDLTRAEAEDIYAARYWRPIKGDDLPMGSDLAVFDLGVNSGVGRASKFAQAVAGVEQDGQIGPKTIAAISRMPARDFIKALCAKRLGFVQSLKIWKTFGKGWSRRITSVEATALSWVSTKPQLETDARDASRTSAGQAGGAVVGTGSGVAVDQAPDASWLPWWAIVGLVILIAAPLVIRAIINAQRAVALSKVAKEA